MKLLQPDCSVGHAAEHVHVNGSSSSCLPWALRSLDACIVTTLQRTELWNRRQRRLLAAGSQPSCLSSQDLTVQSVAQTTTTMNWGGSVYRRRTPCECKAFHTECHGLTVLFITVQVPEGARGRGSAFGATVEEIWCELQHAVQDPRA